MIAVFVTFSTGDELDRSLVTKIAEESRGLFEGMPGLRFKFFTLDDDGRRARNVYIWEDADAGRQFFSAEMVEQVAGAYGIRPTIEYADIVGTVDNSR